MNGVPAKEGPDRVNDARVVASPRFPRGALFDLDGTLLDSAPDMLATVNRLRAERQRPAMALAEIRAHVSRGGRAMIAAAFPDWTPAHCEAALPEFLEVYRSELGRHSHVFDGVESMLAALEADGVRWGIVTNKPEYLARAILPQLGWERRCAVLIGGDTLAERKPHPLPLLTAAERIGLAPADCAYVGDDERDIVAARAAGMPSVVALWGYRQADERPDGWGADQLAELPGALVDPSVWPRR